MASLILRGPRKMECAIGLVSAASQSDFSVDSLDPKVPLLHSKSAHPERSVPPLLDGEKNDVVLLTNKFPRWHDNLQCWCLNFNGRVTLASVKNFQLIACTGRNSTVAYGSKVILQFGKVEKDAFTMDYQYPLSAFQAFAICLSSFDTKIGCN